MVTELDHNAIIARIKAILEADTNVFNPTGGKLRKIIAGRPVEGDTYPYAWIELESEEDKPFEAVTSGGVPVLLSQTSSWHKFNYVITLAILRNKSEKSEEDFLTLVKAVKERMKSNVDLRNPADGTNAKVKMTHPIRMSIRRGADRKGNPVVVGIVTLQCEAITT
jgi:hypothetical protein